MESFEMKYSKGEMLIITGLAALVEEDGKTPREALLIAQGLGQDTFFAL
ncbi:hypothetical protein [Priestia filamentosa]|nr:hypothetical protein [Priestia filamentosa]MDT3762996.1 hypothetical protein [Priestia filamentosa]